MRRFYRRNPDERERQHERAASQGDFEASITLVRSYLRTGKVTEDRVRVLASLKAEPYRTIAEERGPESHGFDVEPLTSRILASPPAMREYLNDLDVDDAVDLMLSAVQLAFKFPEKFGSPEGVERAQSIARVMELVRKDRSTAMARVLWRIGTNVAQRHRRGGYETPGGMSEWQEEHDDAASAHILQSIFFPASRVVVVFYAHEVADEHGMGYGRIDSWWESGGLAVLRVFSLFYKYPTPVDSGLWADALSRHPIRRSGPVRRRGTAPFTRFRIDLAKSLSERWGLPLASATRRRRRRNPVSDRGRYRFVHACTGAHCGEDIQDMVDGAREITYRTFRAKADPVEARELIARLGYDRHFPITRDLWHVGFAKSVYRGVPAVYLVHSAIEHIFTLDGKLGPSLLKGPRRADPIADAFMDMGKGGGARWGKWAP